MAINLSKKKHPQINVTFEVINDSSYDEKLTLWYAKIFKRIKDRLEKEEQTNGTD